MQFDSRSNRIHAVLSLCSSFPIVIILQIIGKSDTNFDKNNNFFANLLILKIFRLWNIIRFVTKLKEILIFMDIKAMILLKFIENFIIIILAKHISACLWMFVSKNQQNPGKKLKNLIDF